MTRGPGPGTLFSPHAQAALRRGLDQLANLVRPTLGPMPRSVVVHDVTSGRPPEILDNAATILRRVIEIPDPYDNMGAMLLRHTVWTVFEAVGDGGATTAVLFQAIMHNVAPYLASGGNAIALRQGLERGCAVASAALRDLARPLEGQQVIAHAAEALCHDPELATLLGEIFDIVGVDGCLQIENGYTRGFDRHYVEGAHWNEGFISPYFITNQDKQEARLEAPAILISDLRLTKAEQLMPLLEHLIKADHHDLLVIADEVSGSALGLLVANHQHGTVRSVAVKAPSHGPYRTQILTDLAVLTGGRVVTEVSGDHAEMAPLADLGQARLVWANANNFGIQGAQGDPHALRQRISEIKTGQASARDPKERDQLRERLGKLLGGVAILHVGGDTESEMNARKAIAEHTAMAVRQAQVAASHIWLARRFSSRCQHRLKNKLGCARWQRRWRSRCGLLFTMAGMSQRRS